MKGSLGKAHLKNLPYLGQCPEGGRGSDQIPTTLTDLGTGGDSQFYCEYQGEKNLLMVSKVGEGGVHYLGQRPKYGYFIKWAFP